jgi:predicted phosphoribosyltransferase
VDDWLATGAFMRADVFVINQQEPNKIIVAIPTAPADTCREFKPLVDEVICLRTPSPFLGIG